MTLTNMRKLFISASTLLLSSSIAVGAEHPALDSGLRLTFSDGSQALTRLDDINKTLHSVGVHVSQFDIPPSAQKVLAKSTTSALNTEETKAVLQQFALDRKALLAQIALAGRIPAVNNGGKLSTSEAGVPPYPKVYDLKSLSPDDFIHVQNKFGKLHVNSAAHHVGVDEVMSIVSGGPWVWFFRINDDVIAKLTLSEVKQGDQGWRISYPGLTPHGAFMSAKHGVVVAYIIGPKTWTMRYQASGVAGAKVLGTNPWIDFSGTAPRLRD